ncbi:MAG: hypothetical protein HOP25_02890 [Methylotenera sp.]|nr:hypothetical protein [Methylotenera sp.]
MNSALTEIDGKMLAKSSATREKSLLILKAARQPYLMATLWPTFLAIFVVSFGLAGLQLPFLPKLIVSVSCMLTFASVVNTWRVQRQLSAAINLLLLNEEQNR